MNALLTFVAGVLLGALSSWLIAHRYYIRTSKDQKAESDRLAQVLRPRNTLEDFDTLLTDSAWDKTIIDHNEVWICQADNTFQIRQGERSREFSERWTTIYPDASGAAYPVYLMINNNVIKELHFISMDGGRIFVPMAEIRPTGENEVEYFWNLSSLEVKVSRVIGTYYIYRDLEGVARMSGVSLIANGG